MATGCRWISCSAIPRKARRSEERREGKSVDLGGGSRSRRRHTRLTCDWSSDVCSSDLPQEPRNETAMAVTEQQVQDALKNLIDPNTRKDYVSGKSARNIKVDGDRVSLDILLGYPAKSQKIGRAS